MGLTGRQKMLLILVLGLATFAAVVVGWDLARMAEFQKTVDLYEKLQAATDKDEIERLEAELQERFNNSMGGRYMHTIIGPDYSRTIITPHNVTVLPPYIP